MPNLIGQSLGRYHIIEQMGEGGMATVYKAYDTRLERDVAVKVIRVDQFGPSMLERILKRFEREAKALARLTHPNIVHINDYGEQDGIPYLVMDFLPGGTLKQRLLQAISWQEAVRLLIPVAQALGYAHENGIIHRDVKPSNILLTEKGQPMLTDFGIAKVLMNEETADLTGTGVGIGTPEYMAPEQTSSKSVDQRADIYALGVVFYEMLTGRRPFEADTPLAVLLKQASEPLPRPRQFNPDLPEPLEKMLFKVLAKNPEDRYQSMGELVDSLESLLRRHISEAEKKLKEKNLKPEMERGNVPSPLVDHRKRANWRWLWAAFGGLGILAFLGTWIFILGQKDHSPVVGLPTNSSDPTRTLEATKTLLLTMIPTYVLTNSSTKTPDLGPITLTFNQNFEGGNMDGFTPMSGDWRVVSEDNTNKALQVTETKAGHWPVIQFGSGNFHNGVIQYRFNIIKTVDSDSDSGFVYIFFRRTDFGEPSYTFQLNNQAPFEELNYVPQQNGEWPSLQKKGLDISSNSWHTVRLEVIGWNFRVYLDGMPLFDAVDSSQRVATGGLGFQGGPESTIWFDDVQVSEFSQ